jgi:hypothetical protein
MLLKLLFDEVHMCMLLKLLFDEVHVHAAQVVVR